MEIMSYSTMVAADRSVGHITALLTRRGVLRIATVYGDDGVPTGLNFSMKTVYGIRDFELPIRVAGVHAALQKDKRTSAPQRTPAHAARVAWRIAFEWLKVQVALIDAGLVTFDELMLPYMVASYDTQTGDAITAYQQYTNNQKQLEN